MLVIEWFESFLNGLIGQPLHKLGTFGHVEYNAFDIVVDENFAQIKYLQNRLSRIVTDGITCINKLPLIIVYIVLFSFNLDSAQP